LLPVWQPIRGETNVCIRIEEAQLGHGRLSVQSERQLPKSEKCPVACQGGAAHSRC
jgi:hypothetical protein